MKYYQRLDCRLCGSKKIESVLKLSSTPPADSFLSEERLNSPQEKIPLELYLCKDCGNTQIGHVIDGEEVYLNYIYETSSTLGLGEHFKDCAADIMNKFKPRKGGLVLDIGSNDGILLKHFKDHGMNVLGVDPMPGIAERAKENGVQTLEAFFNLDLTKKIREEHGLPSVICSNNLVADTDDLFSFVSNVKKLMDDRTIFFFESFYFYLQVKNNVWDFTYHEHYSYFTIKPLSKFFKKLGMEIIDVKTNLTKGGSFRATVQLQGGIRQVSPNVKAFIKKEEEEGFQKKKVFKKYAQQIQRGKTEYLDFMKTLKNGRKKIVGYGACATATTLMYHYEMDGTLDYLVDDFTAKHNLYSPGMKIPVYPSEEIYNNKPDYIIILAWRYYKKIIDRHTKFLESGGKFVIPLPKLKIVSK